MSKKEAEKLENGVTYERERALVLPTISLKPFKAGDELPFTVISEIIEKNETDDNGENALGDDGKEKVLHILQIVNIRTGQEGEIVLPFMVLKALKLVKDGYLNKSFVMVKGEKKNRTDMWAVYPITIK